MNAYLSASQAILDEILDDLAELVRPLDPACLNWRPLASDTNSIAAMVTHVTGSLRWWLGQAVGDAVARDRDAEFQAHHTADELLAMIAAARREVHERIARLAELDPSATRRVSRARHGQDVEVTAAWCLEHAVIHASEHWGQIQLTRQLYTAR